MNQYIAFFVGALILPIGALIAKYATSWIAGFRPRFVKALVSTILAFVVTKLVALGIQVLGAFDDRVLQLAIGWGILACSHIYLLRSEKGERLTPGKAILVALCQIIGGMIGLLLILLIAVAIKQLVT